MPLGCSQCYLLVNCELSTLRPWPPRLLRPHSALYSACAAPLLFLFLLLSDSVMSLWRHGLQHTRPPCPSPLPESAQTHVHRVVDAIQPSHPLLSPSPPALNLSQHQGFFQMSQFFTSGGQVLEFQLQHQSFQWIFRTDFLRMDWLDLLAVQGTFKSLLQHHSSKHQFFRTQLSLQFNSHIHMWLVGKP